ncbi:MAG TPA: hypothetical protein ENJ06_03100 [Phycisphaeraceae bacterium]|nr:hypothetical protein [Phycisphaeraceae bacterium]
MISTSKDNRSVVVTGLGAVTGLGIGVEALWDALLAGRSAVAPMQSIEPGDFPCTYAAEVGEFKARDYVPKKYRKGVKVMARDIELAVGAAMLAVQDAALVTRGTDADAEPTYAPGRCGAQIGAGVIAAEVNELTEAMNKSRDENGQYSLKLWGEQGMGALTPLWLLKYLPNMLACHVTIVHGCEGPSNTITCGEASSLLCIGESMRVIRRGDADLCFTGGAESKLNLLHLIRQYFNGKLASTSPGMKGGDIIRPFDTSDYPGGGVVGEGAGIVIVEARDTAENRGAKMYAEIIGFGSSIASRIDPQTGALTAGPARDGRGMQTAIGAALREAGCQAEDIDAIIPMGAGIPSWDEAEAAALRAVFGERLREIPQILTRPCLGNCGAGSGGIDMAIAALCLKEQKLPARINAGQPPEDLLASSAPAADAALERMLVMSISECGECVALVLQKT